MKSEIRNPKSETPLFHGGSSVRARGSLRKSGANNEVRYSRFGFRVSDFFRVSSFGFRVLSYALIFLSAPVLPAATNSDLPADIPPLRPPRAEIPPTFWEQHGGWVIAGGCVGLLVIAAAIWWLTRPKPPVVLPPEVQARTALEALLGQPEDGQLLSRISQILRHYVVASFGLPSGEYTTAEFCALIEARSGIGTDLVRTLSGFLRNCDQRKFAPPLPQPPLAAVNEALALIEAAEKRRAAAHEAKLEPRV
jgi:hypothetical protein